MISKEVFSAAWNLVSREEHIKKFTLGAAAIVCVLLLSGIHGVAQDEQALHEVYQAQAMGQNTQAGQIFNVTVHGEGTYRDHWHLGLRHQIRSKPPRR